MKKRLIRISLIIVRLLVFFWVVLYLAISVEGSELFTTSPNRAPSKLTPADYGFPYEEISYPASEDNFTMRGWFVPAKSERVVIVLHGKNANRAGQLEMMLPLARDNFNLLLIDLRGHGASAGDHYSYGFFEQRDVLGAVTYLKRRGFRPEHIGVYGFSFGGAPGLLAMGRTPDIRAAISDSTYANLGDTLPQALKTEGRGLFPPIFLPGMLVAARLLHGIDVNGVRPEEALKHLQGSQKVLIFHGEKDNTVPVEHAYRLKAAARNQAELWILSGAEHVQAYSLKPQEYISRVLTFFRQTL